MIVARQNWGRDNVPTPFGPAQARTLYLGFAAGAAVAAAAAAAAGAAAGAAAAFWPPLRKAGNQSEFSSIEV